MAMSDKSKLFITIEDLAAEYGCDRRAVLRRIKEGTLPPLPGNQNHLHNKFKGWPRAFWDAWFSKKAEQMVKNEHITLNI